MVDPAAEESSAAVRVRVARAREVQARRCRGLRSHCNAQLSPTAVRRYCAPEADAGAVLQHAMDRLGLSARAYTRTLKVARTLADLEGGDRVGRRHVLEALQFRRPALFET